MTGLGWRRASKHCGQGTHSLSGSSTGWGAASAILVTTVQQLAERQVAFKVLTGHGAEIDTGTAAGKLVFGIFAALAEFERELMSERTCAGLAAARARGRKGGRKPKLSPTELAGIRARLAADPLLDKQVLANRARRAPGDAVAGAGAKSDSHFGDGGGDVRGRL